MKKSLFSPKNKLFNLQEMPEYAPDTKRIEIEQLHDGTFVCRHDKGHKESYKTLASLLKCIKEDFSSKQEESEVED